jgi:hypothetical protein
MSQYLCAHHLFPERIDCECSSVEVNRGSRDDSICGYETEIRHISIKLLGKKPKAKAAIPLILIATIKSRAI